MEVKEYQLICLYITELNNGPLSVLQQAVKNHSQILIALRNGRKLLARCKAFDRHCNLVLENVKGTPMHLILSLSLLLLLSYS